MSNEKVAKRKHEIDFTQGKMLKNMFAYAIPIVLSSWLQTLFNVVDMMVVGQYEGDGALAAVGSTAPVTNLIVQLFVGLAAGATIVVSQGFGARDEQKMNRASHTAIAMSIVGGVLFALIGILIARPLLTLMGSPSDVIGVSTLYVQVYFAGMPFVFLYNFTSAVMRAYGDNKRPLYFMMLSGVLNVVLNLIAVAWLKWSVAGVAVATFVSQGVAAVLNMICLMRVENACRIRLNKIRFYKKEFLDTLRFGIPAGIQSSVFAISNMFLQSAINSFGSVTMAANGAVNYMGNVVGNVSAGLGHTVTTICAQNYGARKKDRVIAGWRLCLLCTVVVLLVLGLSGTLVMPWFMRIFTNEAETVKIGCKIAWCYIPFWFIGGTMSVSSCALRGVGYATVPMFVTIFGTCVLRIIWVYTIFESYHTYISLYACYPATWLFTSVVQATMFLYLSKRLKYSKQ